MPMARSYKAISSWRAIIFEAYRGSIAYSYQPDPLIVEPFKQVGVPEK